jgi:hypothetical protein
MKREISVANEYKCMRKRGGREAGRLGGLEAWRLGDEFYNNITV